MSFFQFNKISIIESLGEEDRKTGREVFRDLEFLKIYNPDKLETEYSDVLDKAEFIRYIDKLLTEIDSNGVYPILQIDAHGNEDGIKFGKNSYIGWHELLKMLSHLNVSMKNNLLVVLASCYGAHIIRHISHVYRAPFWGVIAPYEKTYPDNVYTGLYKFYNAICLGKNSDDIVSALNTNAKNSDLKFFTAELLFVKTAELAVSEFLRRGSLEDRIKNMAQILRSKGGVFEKSEEQLVADFLILQKEKFQEDLKKFLLVDLYPENIKKINKVHNPWNLGNGVTH